MDRYFLVPPPNWVGTRVPLRFWTNGTVISTFLLNLINFNDFNRFLTWMVFECLPNRYDYKLNNKRDLTSQKLNRVPLQSLALAGLLTLLALLQQSNTLHSFSFMLCTRSKCLVMLLTPNFPLKLCLWNFHWILSAALQFRSGFAPPSAKPHRLVLIPQ